jgi:hypothetical protein
LQWLRTNIGIGIGVRTQNTIQIQPVEAFSVSFSEQLQQGRDVWNLLEYKIEGLKLCRIIRIAVVAHKLLKTTNARRCGAGMHDTQTVAVLVMYALEF